MDNKLLLSPEGGLKAKDIRKPGAYQIVDENDEVRYVGSTSNLYSRFISHVTRLKAGRHENRQLQEYNDDHGGLRFIPAVTSSKEEALEIEQSFLNSNVGNGVLLNIAVDARNPAKGLPKTADHKTKLSAANLGKKASEETRTKMSLARMGNQNSAGHQQTAEHKAKIAKANIGQTRTEEAKRKMGVTKVGNQYSKGHVVPEEAREKISKANGHAITINGVSYSSYNQAGRALGLSPTTVMNRCKSDMFSTWRIKDGQ